MLIEGQSFGCNALGGANEALLRAGTRPGFRRETGRVEPMLHEEFLRRVREERERGCLPRGVRLQWKRANPNGSPAGTT